MPSAAAVFRGRAITVGCNDDLFQIQSTCASVLMKSAVQGCVQHRGALSGGITRRMQPRAGVKSGLEVTAISNVSGSMLWELGRAGERK